MADADRNRGGCFLDLTASRGEHFRIERFLVLFGFCAWKHAAAKTLISCSHFPDESQHVNRTVQVLGWMNQHQTLGHMFGIEPNSYCSNALASVCEKAKAWRQSLSILFSVSSCGFSLDAFSLTAGVAACEKAGRWEQCLRLLEAGQLQRGSFAKK
eukprot:s3_g26.t1